MHAMTELKQFYCEYLLDFSTCDTRPLVADCILNILLDCARAQSSPLDIPKAA